MIAHPVSELPKMLSLLKQLLRAEGLRYGEVAGRIGVSERTLKRYMAGQGLAAETLEELCAVVGVTVPNLAILAARESDNRPGRLSIEQEEALSRELFAAFVFRQLRYGWSAQQVQREFSLSEVELIRCLAFLDRLGLIDLLPGNRARVLTKRVIAWRPGGPIRKAFDKAVKQGFIDMNYGAPGAVWELNTLKLSEAEESRLQALVGDFAGAVMQLSELRSAPCGKAEAWYSVLFAIRRSDPKRLRAPDPAI